jgi:ligand-binding sensor domain-containing protein
MKFCRISALVLINIWLAFPVTAQLKDIRFTSVRSEDGLSSNTVNAIIKDRYGMLWFGTSDGLNRFDGTNFTVYRYKPDDPRSISANEILSLCEDKSGNLWVGTSGGSLNLYDRKTDSFIHFPCSKETNGIHNNVILSICEDFTGNIWIAHFNGINIIDPITKKNYCPFYKSK